MNRFGGLEPWANLNAHQQAQVNWHRTAIRGLLPLRECYPCFGEGKITTRWAKEESRTVRAMCKACDGDGAVEVEALGSGR